MLVAISLANNVSFSMMDSNQKLLKSMPGDKIEKEEEGDKKIEDIITASIQYEEEVKKWNEKAKEWKDLQIQLNEQVNIFNSWYNKIDNCNINTDKVEKEIVFKWQLIMHELQIINKKREEVCDKIKDQNDAKATIKTKMERDKEDYYVIKECTDKLKQITGEVKNCILKNKEIINKLKQMNKSIEDVVVQVLISKQEHESKNLNAKEEEVVREYREYSEKEEEWDKQKKQWNTELLQWDIEATRFKKLSQRLAKLNKEDKIKFYQIKKEVNIKDEEITIIDERRELANNMAEQLDKENEEIQQQKKSYGFVGSSEEERYMCAFNQIKEWKAKTAKMTAKLKNYRNIQNECINKVKEFNEKIEKGLKQEQLQEEEKLKSQKDELIYKLDKQKKEVIGLKDQINNFGVEKINNANKAELSKWYTKIEEAIKKSENMSISNLSSLKEQNKELLSLLTELHKQGTKLFKQINAEHEIGKLSLEIKELEKQREQDQKAVENEQKNVKNSTKNLNDKRNELNQKKDKKRKEEQEQAKSNKTKRNLKAKKTKQEKELEFKKEKNEIKELEQKVKEAESSLDNAKQRLTYTKGEIDLKNKKINELNNK